MSSNSLLALFPGQGSQKVGMGKDLFDNFEIAKTLFAKADEALGFSLSKLCFEGPAEELTATAVAQPAILTVSTICFEIARSKADLPIAAAAGHSLGEYSGLVASGALQFQDAVVLVHKRGKFMQEAVPRGLGRMVAVLGKEVVELETVLKEVTNGVASIANVNAPGQIVVAGNAESIAEFVAKLAGAKVMELPVSAPFHCALMQPAADKLKVELSKLKITRAQFPVYANYSASPVQDPEEIRRALELQVCGRVRWVECMEAAIKDVNPSAAVEFGTGTVLTGLLKRINSQVKRVNLGSTDALNAPSLV